MRRTALSAIPILPVFRGVIISDFFFPVTFHTSNRNRSVTDIICLTMAATAKERFALINENLQEILNPELIESILEKGDSPRIYWGKHSTHVLYAVGHVTKGFFFPLCIACSFIFRFCSAVQSSLPQRILRLVWFANLIICL